MGPRPIGKKAQKRNFLANKKGKNAKNSDNRFPSPNKEILKSYFQHLSNNINGKKISLASELNYVKTFKYVEYFPENITFLRRIRDNSFNEESPTHKDDVKNESDERTIQLMKLNSKEEKIIERLNEIQEDENELSNILDESLEIPRPKTHWDYLLAEMKWLAEDFYREKSWKRVAAKKLANSAVKVIKEKTNKISKEAKQETYKVKRHCAMISKMVKDWWKQMEKIVLAKQQLRLNAKRQEAVTSHLGKVIETTEKYTEWLTEDLKASQNSNGNDECESSIEDPEFKVDPEILDSDSAHDDEETIEKDEAIDGEEEVHKEVKELTNESELDLEHIIDKLPDQYREYLLTGKCTMELDENNSNDDKEEDKESESQTESDNESDEENESSFDDDEETLIEQEKFETNDEKIPDDKQAEQNNNNDTDDNELSKLAKDANIPMEELIQMYNDSLEKTKDYLEPTNDDDNDEEMEENTSTISSSTSSRELEELEKSDVDSEESKHSESFVDLKEVFPIEKKIEDSNKEEFSFEGEFQALTEAALSTQPKGNTIESAGGVKVKIPHLIRHTLREYQHVGLDWLAAIYEKRFNGILADEMGLGKTIQTIAVLAYLACEKGIWGPHLIVVPTSVILNWEMEFKKWCPGFKLLTYYGSAKERRDKRKGWTKTNAFHVCITSYKLAIQDSLAFKRKKWKYFILDEAQNIKNFKSKRWQTLLTFNSQRRLLLTGTPLQNNLMELWSLMHFLMPHIFQSHKEFQEWFGSPLTGMIEGNAEYNEQLVKRLHKVLRPFILRRLKKDVEKQMPKKYEHIVMCHLSKRQRCLYDDFMSLTSTQETLSGGQFLSVINILMQLRKVCNHPNLFECRPINSPFLLTDSIVHEVPRCSFLSFNNQCSTFHLPSLVNMSRDLPSFINERIFQLKPRPNLIQQIDDLDISDWVLDNNITNGSNKPSRSLFTRSMFLSNIEETPNFANNSDQYVPQLQSLSKTVALRENLGIRISQKPRDTILLSSSNNGLPIEIIESRHQKRLNTLGSLAKHNDLRINLLRCIDDLYSPDLRNSVNIINKDTWSKSCTYDSIFTSNRLLIGRTLKQMFCDNIHLIRLFKFNVTPILSYGIKTTKRFIDQQNDEKLSESLLPIIKDALPDEYFESRIKDLLQFPETRLIQYDCGKLQVLEVLLKRLYRETHRCLIFTQMTRMLDILEHFLSYLGYRYLRLDGSTRVEQRQYLMETFNQDSRIFIFILSTRSGGLGVNLTGADTVIFYDSDWNPTMDAQAQDRCHRIGQTRDVHIYRLISRMTVEENILKKANQKRTLNDMAIEGGQFNTSFFKSSTLKDLFKAPSGLEDFIGMTNKNEDNEQIEEITLPPETKQQSIIKTRSGREISWRGPPLVINNNQNNIPTKNMTPAVSEVNLTKQTSNGGGDEEIAEFEAALEQIEEENDLEAAHRAKAEVAADLDEFNEDIPWDESEQVGDGTNNQEEAEEESIRLDTERQIKQFEEQLNPIQRFGVQVVESLVEDTLADQLEIAQQNLESSKKTWHLEQLKALHEADEMKAEIDEDDMLYCYGKYDISAQKRELERIKREEAKLTKEEEDKKQQQNSQKRSKDNLNDDGNIYYDGAEQHTDDMNWLRKQHLIAMKRKNSDNSMKLTRNKVPMLESEFNVDSEDSLNKLGEEIDEYLEEINNAYKSSRKLKIARTNSMSNVYNTNLSTSQVPTITNIPSTSNTKMIGNKCAIPPSRSSLYIRQNKPTNYHNSGNNLNHNIAGNYQSQRYSSNPQSTIYRQKTESINNNNPINTYKQQNQTYNQQNYRQIISNGSNTNLVSSLKSYESNNSVYYPTNNNTHYINYQTNGAEVRFESQTINQNPTIIKQKPVVQSKIITPNPFNQSTTINTSRFIMPTSNNISSLSTTSHILKTQPSTSSSTSTVHIPLQIRSQIQTQPHIIINPQPVLFINRPTSNYVPRIVASPSTPQNPSLIQLINQQHATPISTHGTIATVSISNTPTIVGSNTTNTSTHYVTSWPSPTQQPTIRITPQQPQQKYTTTNIRPQNIITINTPFIRPINNICSTNNNNNNTVNIMSSNHNSNLIKQPTISIKPAPSITNVGSVSSNVSSNVNINTGTNIVSFISPNLQQYSNITTIQPNNITNTNNNITNFIRK